MSKRMTNYPIPMEMGIEYEKEEREVGGLFRYLVEGSVGFCQVPWTR